MVLHKKRPQRAWLEVLYSWRVHPSKGSLKLIKWELFDAHFLISSPFVSSDTPPHCEHRKDKESNRDCR